MATYTAPAAEGFNMYAIGGDIYQAPFSDTAARAQLNALEAQRHMGDYHIARKTPAASYPAISGATRPLITWNGTYQLVDKCGNVIDEFTNNSTQQPYAVGSNGAGVVYWDTANRYQGKVTIATSYTESDTTYPLGYYDAFDMTMPATWIGIKHTVGS